MMDIKEFKLRKKLLEIEGEQDKKKNEYHMTELEFQKELENLKFDNQKQIQRIRSAEIRKNIERKKFDYG